MAAMPRGALGRVGFGGTPDDTTDDLRRGGDGSRHDPARRLQRIRSSVAPSAAGQATAAPETTAPSAAPASEAPSAEASNALPSFALPSDDKGLEALLPDADVRQDGDQAQLRRRPLRELADADLHLDPGRRSASRPTDVVVRDLEPGRSRALGICRRAPASSGSRASIRAGFTDVYMAEAQKQSGTTDAAQRRRQGCLDRDVHDDGTKTYAYFNGDAIFIVTARWMTMRPPSCRRCHDIADGSCRRGPGPRRHRGRRVRWLAGHVGPGGRSIGRRAGGRDPAGFAAERRSSRRRCRRASAG